MCILGWLDVLLSKTISFNKIVQHRLHNLIIFFKQEQLMKIGHSSKMYI